VNGALLPANVMTLFTDLLVFARLDFFKQNASLAETSTDEALNDNLEAAEYFSTSMTANLMPIFYDLIAFGVVVVVVNIIFFALQRIQRFKKWFIYARTVLPFQGLQKLIHLASFELWLTLLIAFKAPEPRVAGPVIALVFIFVYCVLITVLLTKYKESLLNSRMVDWMLGIHYDELRDVSVARLHLLVFFTRRLLIALVLICLQSYPTQQLQLVIGISILHAAYLGYIQPYVDRLRNTVELTEESLIVAMTGVLLLLQRNASSFEFRFYGLGNMLVGLVFVHLAFHFVLQIYILYLTYKIHQRYKVWRETLVVQIDSFGHSKSIMLRNVAPDFTQVTSFEKWEACFD